MKQTNKWTIVVLLIISIQIAACAPKSVVADKVPASKTEEIDGSDFKRVILTEKAVERLDIQTAPVGMDGSQKVVPYAAVLYGLDGETWTYTNPEPLVYIRHIIVIDHIDGDKAFLTDGPDVDTSVVTVGVSLLYGAEVGVSK